jgi:hypothetical protein
MREPDLDVEIMMHLATWIEGTIHQCKRLLAVSGRASERMHTIVEEEFVVVAARRLIRWTNEAIEHQTVSADKFREVLELVPTITDLRDMREHGDDHIVRRKGRKQFQYIHHARTEQGLTYTSDATATIVLPGNYFIGGRLSVERLLTAAKAAQAEFHAVASSSDRLRWLLRDSSA